MQKKQLFIENPELDNKIISLAETRLGYPDDSMERIRILEEAFSLIPKPANQWEDPTEYIANNLCVEYHAVKKYEEAIKWGEMAVDARSDIADTGVFVNLGIAYYHNNNLEKAFFYFDQAYNTRNSKNRAFLGYEPIYFDFYREKKGLKLKRKSSKTQ